MKYPLVHEAKVYPMIAPTVGTILSISYSPLPLGWRGGMAPAASFQVSTEPCSTPRLKGEE